MLANRAAVLDRVNYWLKNCRWSTNPKLVPIQQMNNGGVTNSGIFHHQRTAVVLRYVGELRMPRSRGDKRPLAA